MAFNNHQQQQQRQGQQQLSSRRNECNTIEGILEKITEACKKRGAAGFKQFSRMFRLYDDDRSHDLSRGELKDGLLIYGVDLSANEMRILMENFDRDGSGTVSIDELVRGCQPALAPCREQLVRKAFNVLNKGNDTVITVEDIKDVYNVRQHPKFQSGEWTKHQCLEEFLHSFETDPRAGRDGKVTWKEFYDYYVGVSASIERDVYFDFMMRQTWKF